MQSRGEGTSISGRVVPATNPGAKANANTRSGLPRTDISVSYAHNHLPGWPCSKIPAKAAERPCWSEEVCSGSSSPRLGVCGIACLLCDSSGSGSGKDDHAAGADGIHGGYGVGGARRVGVRVPSGRQRDRPRHAGRGDWPLRRRLNLTSGTGNPPF